MGIIRVVSSAKPGIDSDGRSSGVSIAPGHTQFTRIPREAYSMAATRVRLITPALAVL